MNAKELIKLNNEKRDQLDKENLTYYEEMLVYVRLSFNISEQQTEEVLMELLDHILQAQAEGRKAEDVFGDHPKAYCREIISELPKEPKKKQFRFIAFLGLQYLGIIALVSGILTTALSYLFGIGSKTIAISTGSGLVTIVIDLLILASFVTFILLFLKGTLFKAKQLNKWLEFLILWVISTIHITLFILPSIFIPDFGASFTLPAYWIAIVGAILYGGHYLLRSKNTTY